MNKNTLESILGCKPKDKIIPNKWKISLQLYNTWVDLGSIPMVSQLLGVFMPGCETMLCEILQFPFQLPGGIFDSLFTWAAILFVSCFGKLSIWAQP